MVLKSIRLYGTVDHKLCMTLFAALNNRCACVTSVSISFFLSHFPTLSSPEGLAPDRSLSLFL